MVILTAVLTSTVNAEIHPQMTCGTIKLNRSVFFSPHAQYIKWRGRGSLRPRYRTEQHNRTGGFLFTFLVKVTW